MAGERRSEGHETVGERFGFAGFERELLALRNEGGTELVPGDEAVVLRSASGVARDLLYEVEDMVRTLERATHKALDEETRRAA